jgi:hypothetical protein
MSKTTDDTPKAQLNAEKSEHIFVNMLVKSRRVTEEQIRWQLASGNLNALTHQKENVRRISETAWGYDLSTCPREQRAQVELHVARVKACVLQYNLVIRKSKKIPDEECLVKICRSYDEVITAGHDLCALVFPKFIVDYDEKFGFTAR